MLGEPDKGIDGFYIVGNSGVYAESISIRRKEIDSLNSTKIITLSNRSGNVSINEFLVPQIDSLYNSFSEVVLWRRGFNKDKFLESIFKTISSQNTEPLESLLKLRVYL